MNKNRKKDNTLIKRKNLILMLKQAGINRVSEDALGEIGKALARYVEKLIPALKEELAVSGRATLKKEDIISIIRKRKEEFWEI